MDNFRNGLFKALNNNKLINNYFTNLKVEGENPWDLKINFKWKEIEELEISSFSLSDIWALQYWWVNSLSYDNRRFHPIFPCDERIGMYIANHYKDHENHTDITFNAWLIKEEGTGFNNEIIGHFYVWRYSTGKPSVGLGVADKFQNKKLGTLFILIMIYITKLSGRDVLWLTTDLDNQIGNALYKKLDFEDAGEVEVFIPADGYNRVEREMKLDLNKYD